MSRYTALFTDQPEAAAPQPKAEPTRYRILLVDDEPNVLRALTRVFREEQYDIVGAASGKEALALLERTPAHLLITDHRMPEMTGADLLKRAKALHPDMIRIMLTGQADIGAVMGAVNDGAVYKFILKPWHDDDLRVTVALALERYELLRENHALKKDLQKKAGEVSALARLSVGNRSRLGAILVKQKLLDDKQVKELQGLQASRNEPFIKLLLRKQWVGEKALHAMLKKEFRFEEVALAELAVPPTVAVLLPKAFCEKQWVIPVRLEGRQLLMAMADPTDLGLQDDLRFMAGLEVRPALAAAAAIEAKIKEVYGDDGPALQEADGLIEGYDPCESVEVVIEEDDGLTAADILKETEGPPAIRIVNAIILEAVRLNASDIHIQPKTKSVVVRYRIDGILQDKIQLPHHLHMAVVSRMKIMAELDIAERRKPQDGRITVKTPARIVDLRISTLPTINGEKLVLRIMDRNAPVRNLGQLGFTADQMAKVKQTVARPQGLILATGPTGSGKTTTLYSLLQHNAATGKNYVTLEDPVEFYLDMAGQVHVKQRIGLDFPSVLRAILRQDPDVILLGEIRDYETAEVAFHAAMTGHMVFSTLHTNSAVATIARLQDMGLKPYIIAAALEGIISQRLVRKICEGCRRQVAVTESVLSALGPMFAAPSLTTYAGEGCDHCHGSGYDGRVAIYEVLVLDESMRQLIASGASLRALASAAKRAGATTLLESAWTKVNQGETTVAEVLRVLGPQGDASAKCPACHASVETGFDVCPFCATPLRLSCAGCRTALESTWVACPSCGLPPIKSARHPFVT